MNTKSLITITVILLTLTGLSAQKKSQVYNEASFGKANSGTTLMLTFDAGKSYNHPLYAVWLADAEGKYIQTLYVSESVGKGTYIRSTRNKGIWQAGEIQRPATLPYWIHQRNELNENGGLLPTPRKPVADAYTGATIKNSFRLRLNTHKVLSGKYKVYFEINQSWDWNNYWHNNKYPDDKEYKTSSQPAVVYCADIDTETPTTVVKFTPIGHSHYSGADGSLNADLSTLTTALEIAEEITIQLISHK